MYRNCFLQTQEKAFQKTIEHYQTDLANSVFASSEFRRYVPPQEELPNIRSANSVDLTINVMFEMRTIPVDLQTTTVREKDCNEMPADCTC